MAFVHLAGWGNAAGFPGRHASHPARADWFHSLLADGPRPAISTRETAVTPGFARPACRTAAVPGVGPRRLRRSRRSSLLEPRTREVLKLAGDSLVFLFILGTAMGTMWGLSLL